MWKQKHCSLSLHSACHRSRTLALVLLDSAGRMLALTNCHLEGAPQKGLAQVRQLQCALLQLHPLPLHALLVTGDFNCPRQGSPRRPQSLARLGGCPGVDGHGFDLQLAKWPR